MKPQFNTIIWDFNGTLLHDVDAIIDANNEINRRYGIPPITKEHYRQHFSHPPMAFYEAMGYNFEEIPYKKISAEFIACYQEKQTACGLTPGVLAALEEFCRRGMEQMVFSAHNQRLLEEKLEQLGVKHYFSHIDGEEGVVVTGKVQRAKGLAAGRDLSHALLIGDTSHDFETAAALGCACVLFSGGHEDAARLQKNNAPVFETIEALTEYILK